MSQIRNALLILKQYGFTDKSLEYIYMNETFDTFMESLFNKNNIMYNKYQTILTEKEKTLAQDKLKFIEFVKVFKQKMFDYKKKGIKVYFKYDEGFPDFLFPENKIPLFLYCYGEKKLIEKRNKKIAIIGSRNATVKGKNETKQYVKQFVKKKYITVSGLAKGIDTIVHEETLRCGGRTIAILPTSFEKVYPKENQQLFEKIIKSNRGLAITLKGPFENTYKSDFLERNSIVAKMSNKVLLIEANQRSGTISTINRAHNYNKDIIFDSSLLSQDMIDILLNIGAKDIKGG